MEDTTYLDLIVLRKIESESTVEKFGTVINTSFFETANLLGTLKVKGLINIETAIGGQSPVFLTGEGKDLLEHASRKAAEPLDALDSSILSALGGGVRDLAALEAAINIRPRDLAFHLHKLAVNEYIDYEVRSAKVALSLTEKGFNMAGGMKAEKGATTSSESDAKNAPGASQPQGQAAAAPAAGAFASSAKPQSGGAPPWVKPSAEAAPSHAPPWANLFSSKKHAAPEDIADILSAADSAQKAAPANAAKSAAPQAQPAKPAAASAQSAKPDAAKQMPEGQQKLMAEEKPLPMEQVRLFSKLDYYATNYLGYILLVLALVILLVYAAQNAGEI